MLAVKVNITFKEDELIAYRSMRISGGIVFGRYCPTEKAVAFYTPSILRSASDNVWAYWSGSTEPTYVKQTQVIKLTRLSKLKYKIRS